MGSDAEQASLSARAASLRDRADYGGVQGELLELFADLAAAVEGSGSEPSAPQPPADTDEQQPPAAPDEQQPPAAPDEQPPPADQTG